MQLPTFKSSSLLQYWVEPASRSVHLSEYGARFDYVQFYEAFEAIALYSRMDVLHLGLNLISETGCRE
jgi:hypothetical protein